jgi:predicted transcriptional regulator YdeE
MRKKMEKETLHINEMKLVGLKTITCNQDEADPLKAKIGNLIMNQYYGREVPDKILNRKNPGKTFGIYTDYESDYTGKYTYIVGEEVASIEDINADLVSKIIPSGTYIKFTTDYGEMPKVLVEVWQQIWQMNDRDLGGKRNYKADFEIYHQNEAEIYIGVDIISFHGNDK